MGLLDFTNNTNVLLAGQITVQCGLTDMNQSDLFTFADRTHSTRGDAYKLLPSHCRVDVRKCFFLLKEY